MGKAIEELAHFVGRRAGATDRDRWSGRDRLRAGLADGGLRTAVLLNGLAGRSIEFEPLQEDRGA